MINNTIVAVFKSIALCAILLVVMSFGTTVFVLFSTYSKLDSVCQLMQSELSRNNCMLAVSMTGDNGFIAQLKDICEMTTTQGTSDNLSESVQMISLSKIEVKTEGVDDPFVYYENGEITEAVEPLGAYGTIKTLYITFDTNIVFATLVGGANVQRVNNGTSSFTITYNAPCLRYIK